MSEKNINLNLNIEKGIINENISWDKFLMSTDKNIQKSNAVIDGRTRNYTLLSKNLMNVVLFLQQQKKTNNFEVPLVTLRDFLKLQKTKSYKSRIEYSLTQLSQPIELRDFTFKGKDIKYINVSFLEKPYIYHDGYKNIANITISEEFVAALEQKSGFTILEFMKLLECSSTFGHEIAQMIIRYKNLPNKKNNALVRITKTIEELNDMFSTNYKYKSDMQRKLDKAYKDIKENMNMDYFYMWDDLEKCFIFSWEKDEKPKLNCKFPQARLKELAEWIYQHYPTKDKIDDKGKFISSTIQKLKQSKWDNAESAYRQMLKVKHNILDPDMFYDAETEKYIDFKEKK